MKIESYEFMEGSYESLNYYANEMLTYVNTIKSIVKNLDNNGHWDGNGFNEYNNKLCIEDGKLVYIPEKVSENEAKWLEEMDIKAKQNIIHLQIKRHIDKP